MGVRVRVGFKDSVGVQSGKKFYCLRQGTSKRETRPFWGFWGAYGAGYVGLAATTWLPMGAQVPVLSPNDHPNPFQGRQKGFGKGRILKNFQEPLNNLNKGNFGAFGGPMARATWAWRLLSGSLWVLKYLYCHQMITQTHPKGDKRVSEKVEL